MSERMSPIKLTAAESASLKERATLSEAYDFLDTAVSIKSDAREVLDFFRQAYRYFLSRHPGEEAAAYAYYVLTDAVSPSGPILLHGENRAYRLVRGDTLCDCADVIIFNSILSRITSYLLVHGAAVSSRGEAAVLTGLTGSGKSTLALELVRRGLKFCSDEIAAVSRSTHRIHPFPRAVGMREGSLAILDAIDARAGKPRHTTGGETKLMIDVEDLFGPSISDVCRGKCLFLLETTAGEDGRTEKDYHNINIMLKRSNDELIERLRATQGVQYRSSTFDGRLHRITVRIRKNIEAQRSFLQICRQFEGEILHKVKAVERPPDPGQDPRCSPAAHMDVALELLGNMQNLVETDGWMKEGSGANAPRTLFELASAIAPMKCYRLLVGNVRKTADLVVELMQS